MFQVPGIYIYINIRIPRTEMTLVLIGKGLVFGGLTFKNRGQFGSRYIHIYTHTRCIYTYNIQPFFGDVTAHGNVPGAVFVVPCTRLKRFQTGPADVQVLQTTS